MAKLGEGRTLSTQERAALVKKRLQNASSLDTPEDQSLQEIAADVLLGATPAGIPQAGRDFERARREGDYLGMGLATLGGVPVVGGATKAVRSGSKIAKAASKASKVLDEATSAEKLIPKTSIRDSVENAVEVAGKKAAGKKKAAVGNLFDSVDNYDEALAMSKRGEHLKRTPDGKYVGAPADVDSPQKLARNRKAAQDKVEEGAFNADWYDRARDAASETSGYDAAKQGYGTASDEGKMASMLARGGAAYSPQATPPTEINAFLRQHNAKMVGGEDVIPRTGAQARNVAQAYSPNEATGGFRIDPEKVKLGKKTGPYADAKDPTIDEESLYKTANDIWHGRVMGYGKDFDRGFTPQEHGFLTGENLLLADAANAKGFGKGELPADFKWNPRSAQAATWGSQRLESYMLDDAQKIENAIAAGKRPPKPESYESMKARASAGIDDALARHPANENYEYVTGENVGHLAGMNRADDATRANYTNRVSDAYLGDARMDPIYESFQMYQKPTINTEGKYMNSAGDVEFNPGRSARPLVSLEASDLGLTSGGKPKAGGPQMVQQDANAMRYAALLRSYLAGQEGVGFNKFTPANSSSKGFEKTGVHFTPSDQAGLHSAQEAFEKAGLDTINNGTNVVAGRFPVEVGPQVPGQVIQKMASKALRNLEGNATAGRFESGLEMPNWVPEQGTGAASRDLVQRLTEDPAYAVHNAAQRIDAGRLPAAVGKHNAIDEAVSAETGMPLRNDLMEARRIVAEKGVQGLIDYVKRTGGKGLPAVVAAPVGAGYLAGDGQQEY